MTRPRSGRSRRGARAIAAAVATVATAGCMPAGVHGGQQPAPADGLAASIDSMIGGAEFRNAHWGILVVDPTHADTLYSRNAGKLFMPASNMKIVTGATALAQLGPDYRFRTTFVARGPVSGGILHGDLVVVGRGDPTVSDHMRGDALTVLAGVADSLAARGVTRIDGRVRAGGDAFPDAQLGFGWEWDDADFPYGAGVDELLLNEGFTTVVVRSGEQVGDPAVAWTLPARHYPALRVLARTVPRGAAAPAPGGAAAGTKPKITLARDSATGGIIVGGTIALGDSTSDGISYADPSRAYLEALDEALVARGLGVGGAQTDTTVRQDTLFTLLSPPLREILPALEKPSQNQIAEVLFKTLGLEKTGVGSADSGRRVVESQLAAWGAAPDGYVVHDGSGLSRHDYLTPETLVRVLTAVSRDTAFAVFYDALPVGGVDGTIGTRMRGTPAQGNVHAKTGYIDRARSLSGYVTTADGRKLVFSVLCNNFTTPVGAVERVQDEIAVRLARLRGADPRGR